jgi:hypothetical protein
MGWMVVLGACVGCGSTFSFNPDRVPSIRARRVQDDNGRYRWQPHPEGEREPLCRPCVERANIYRRDNGLPPIVIYPDSYEPLEAP